MRRLRPHRRAMGPAREAERGQVKEPVSVKVMDRASVQVRVALPVADRSVRAAASRPRNFSVR